LGGPRLSTLACYLKGVCHGSYRTVQSFFNEVIGLDLSVRLLAKAIRKMTVALGDLYQESIEALSRQPVLGLDLELIKHLYYSNYIRSGESPQ